MSSESGSKVKSKSILYLIDNPRFFTTLLYQSETWWVDSSDYLDLGLWNYLDSKPMNSLGKL